MREVMFFLRYARAAAVVLALGAVSALLTAQEGNATGGSAVCMQSGNAPDGEPCQGVILDNDLVIVLGPLVLLGAVILFFCTPALRRFTLRRTYNSTYARTIRPLLNGIEDGAEDELQILARIWAAHEVAAEKAANTVSQFIAHPFACGVLAETMVETTARMTDREVADLREAGLTVSPGYRRFLQAMGFTVPHASYGTSDGHEAPISETAISAAQLLVPDPVCEAAAVRARSRGFLAPLLLTQPSVPVVAIAVDDGIIVCNHPTDAPLCVPDRSSLIRKIAWSEIEKYSLDRFQLPQEIKPHRPEGSWLVVWAASEALHGRPLVVISNGRDFRLSLESHGITAAPESEPA